MSHALRHAPWQYELELDDEGWVLVDQLLEGLHELPHFQSVTRHDFEEVINNSTKSRFELQGDHIRALYGHSVPGKLSKKEGTPPNILYHGTQTRFLTAIRQEGLKPMARQYVHLSIDTTMARTVGSRRGSQTVILQIQAGAAAQHGVKFYEGNAQVWLADFIPPEWIIFS